MNTRLILFLIIIFGLILRLIFFSGVGTSDDLAYSTYAANIDKGIDPGSTLTLAVRLGLVYTTALSYSIFGINDFSSVLFILLTSIGNIILVYLFGKLFFNERVGLMAAFLLSFFPMDVAYSTKLLSDLPSAFFMALGVYYFLYSEKTSRLKYGIGYLFSGISIGIGYLIRESVLLIGLFFLVYIIYKRRIKSHYFLVPLGFLIIFGIESLIFLMLAGDPLYRSNISQQYLSAAVSLLDGLGRSSLSGLFHYPFIIFTSNLISVFYIFIFIAIAYTISLKKKESYVMIFWFVALLVYLSFGTSSPLSYIPFKAAPRYLSIITIPGILLLAYFLMDKESLIRKAIMPSVLIILFFSSIGFLYINNERTSTINLETAHSFLKDSKIPVYTDQRSKMVFDYLSGFKENNFIKFNSFENALYEGDRNSFIMNLTSASDAYIVINYNMVQGLPLVHKTMRFPSEVYDPPDNWVLVKEIGNKPDDILIYYAP